MCDAGAGGSKSQIPKNKSQTNTKFQTPKLKRQASDAFVWNLELEF
jgi:hypothetical protein